MSKFRMVCFGCKVNQYETELLRQTILKHVAGSREVFGRWADSVGAIEDEATDGADSLESTDESPDLVIVHTCTVTAESDAKCRRAIRHFARTFPKAIIAVGGCYVRRQPGLFAKDQFPEVDVVLDSDTAIVRFLTELAGNENRNENGDTAESAANAPAASTSRFGDDGNDGSDGNSITATLRAGLDAFPRLSRATLKIQDGCTQRCSYCIVPDSRPGLASRPRSVVLAEAKRLLAAGHRELVLTGTHLGLYGLNWSPSEGSPPVFTSDSLAPRSGDSLTDLAWNLVELPSEVPYRIRLSSLEAPELTPGIIRVAAERSDRFCPHFHLPMQHASDAVLRQMRRRWSSERFIERCLEVRETLPGVSLTTDVMVGFPGETDEDFAILCETIRRIGFSGVHIFRYSRREGTIAATLQNQIPSGIKRERAAALAEVVRECRQTFWRRHCTEYPRRHVVVEGISPYDPRRAIGTDEYYATCELPLGTVREDAAGNPCYPAWYEVDAPQWIETDGTARLRANEER